MISERYASRFFAFLSLTAFMVYIFLLILWTGDGIQKHESPYFNSGVNPDTTFLGVRINTEADWAMVATIIMINAVVNYVVMKYYVTQMKSLGVKQWLVSVGLEIIKITNLLIHVQVFTSQIDFVIIDLCSVLVVAAIFTVPMNLRRNRGTRNPAKVPSATKDDAEIILSHLDSEDALGSSSNDDDDDGEGHHRGLINQGRNKGKGNGVPMKIIA